MHKKILHDFNEKTFLKDIISKYARTASTKEFDDCIIIDLNQLLKADNLPYFVYSIDHPSFIQRPKPIDETTAYRFYGRWVTAIVCGDVLAMGAKPRGFSLDIAAPLSTEVNKLEYILQGVVDVLSRYGTEYEGGNFDTNALEMVGMAWGIVDQDKIIRRLGAQVGDFIAVTTTLGYGWADYVSRKLDKSHLLSANTRQNFHEFKMMPIAPHEAILEAVEVGGITSGMDLSDGLIEFLYTILEKNQLGSRVYEEWITVKPEMEEVANNILNIRPTLLALEAGYDTPLGHAYTINPDKWDKLSAVFEKYNSKLYKIGIVQKEPEINLQTLNNKLITIPPFWDDQFNKEHTIERWKSMINRF